MQVLIKLCSFAPGPMLGFIEGSLGDLKKALEEVIKDTATVTDRERAMDLKRACLSVIKAYTGLENVESSPFFVDFIAKMQMIPVISELMKEVGLIRS